MVSDTDEDDDDIPLVNNRLEDVTAEVSFFKFLYDKQQFAARRHEMNDKQTDSQMNN